MNTLRSLWIAAVAVIVMGAAQAATVLDADFSKGRSGFVLNGDAVLATIDGRQVVSLTQNRPTQTATIWSSLKKKVPSFSFIADVRVRHSTLGPQGEQYNSYPADGLTMVFAPVSTDAMGFGGGSLGLFGLGTLTAFEINTWVGNGLREEPNNLARGDDSKDVTFAFDVVHPGVAELGRHGERGTPAKGGARIGQVVPPARMKVVNGGWYRYQWNALADGRMVVYVTGLEEQNKQFRKAKVLEVMFPNTKQIDFAGRWGLTAATGGAVQAVEVRSCRVEVPAVPPD